MVNKNYIVTLSAIIMHVSALHAMRTPTFSLKNNSTQNIRCDLRQNGESILDDIVTIKANQELSRNIDITQGKTVLHLFFCPAHTDCSDTQTKLSTAFPKDKTIYIKFDGTNIEIQRGSKNQTTLGFSLAHNITNNDFTVVSSTTPTKLVGATRSTNAPSAPPRPMVPAPTKPIQQKLPKPPKPAADTKPYHNLAWAQFPQANGIKNNNTALMQRYYEQSNDAHVMQMAYAVLGVQPGASNMAINTAYSNTMQKFSTQEFISNPKLHDEIVKIINTAHAILTK